MKVHSTMSGTKTFFQNSDCYFCFLSREENFCRQIFNFEIFKIKRFIPRMASQIESNEVIDRLVEADPTLSQFLNDDFQSEEYAMKIVTSEVVADVLDSLNKESFLKT